AAFQAAYGTSIPIAGEYNGKLDLDGETLKLVRNGLTTNDLDVVIDKVRYEARAPWPLKAAVTNSGVSLQLIDSSQDNARVSNWDDGSSWRFYSFSAKPTSSGSSKLFLYLNA